MESSMTDKDTGRIRSADRAAEAHGVFKDADRRIDKDAGSI